MPSPEYRIAPDDWTLTTKAVTEGLVEHNESFLGPMQKNPLAVSARDPDGGIVGGAVGRILYGCLQIDLLWVEDRKRGKGIGSEVLRTIEDEARRQGATRAFTFQAAPFYEKAGYVEVARIPRYFREYDRIYLMKEPL